MNIDNKDFSLAEVVFFNRPTLFLGLRLCVKCHFCHDIFAENLFSEIVLDKFIDSLKSLQEKLKSEHLLCRRCGSFGILPESTSSSFIAYSDETITEDWLKKNLNQLHGIDE